MPHVLLLGGHGKVSLLLTPKIVSRGWDLTSLIRNPEQKPTILETGKNGPGKINVLVESLEDVKSEGDAKRILENVKPDWIVWSAGAGGKGGAERTNAIDRDACIHFTRAAISISSIKKFLLVSALSSRRERAPWWDDDSWSLIQKMNTQIIPAYYQAKIVADETLTVLGEERAKRDKEWSYIILRPGGLSDEPETGKVALGKTKARGLVSRGDVADVAARLLEKEGARGWIDLIGGEEETGEAVERVVRERVDVIEGEDVQAMKSRI